jgi:hypothetical protein
LECLGRAGSVSDRNRPIRSLSFYARAQYVFQPGGLFRRQRRVGPLSIIDFQIIAAHVVNGGETALLPLIRASHKESACRNILLRIVPASP